jgi:glycerophosphoryl diester phosphodiesterase
VSPSCRSAPPSRSTRWWPSVSKAPSWLIAQPFAHRGLHGPGRVENSRAAFAAAIEHGHGIELDVRISGCSHAIVFHDATLDRLCGRPGLVSGLDQAALAGTRFVDSEETIPTLDDVLALVAGNVPLLIEIKAEAKSRAMLCRAVAAALEGYDGPAAIMSFDPLVARWFAKAAPGRVRGLVVTEEGKKNFRGLLERRLARIIARPDFLAYDIRDLPSAFAARARAQGLALLTWTVRTEAQRSLANAHADQIIHELPARR